MPAQPERNPARLLVPLAGVFAGVLLLAVLGLAERTWWAAQPWHNAVVRAADAEVPDESLRLRVITLPRGIVPADAEMLDAMELHPETRAIVETFGAYTAERLAVFDAPPEAFAPVLASGRLPEPGAPEVLAGVLTRVDAFEVAGTEFRVVGTLARSARGLDFLFVLPDGGEWEGLFGGDRDFETAYYETDAGAAEAPEERDILGLTHPGFTWPAIACLLLIAGCGALFQVRLFVAVSRFLPRPFRPLTGAIAEYPGLLLALHALLLGTFIVAMCAGANAPLWNARIFGYISHTFTEGDLAHISHAFDTGSPLQFAGSIFFNNYVVQTLIFTFLVSVPPFALGVLKTLFSFAVAGFGMAPIWVGALSGYSYHSLTMTLEFEPYILACFAVLLWPLHLVRATVGGVEEIWKGARIFLSAMLWSGVLLLGAALYEAVTLMLFN